AIEHRSQHLEDSSARFLRVEEIELDRVRFKNGSDAIEHGKELAERAPALREKRAGFRVRKGKQEAREVIDDAVERLVGYRLALVTAAPKHEHFFTLAHPSDELSQEPAFANAGAALDEQGDALARSAFLERGLDRVELMPSADEVRVPSSWSSLVRADTEPLE